mmetsp:Transcript_8521/g.14709  ORF Transcript_8521/g.14709 Transcript_8521/m.14709 type:complete len:163 (-) Transcript_8521:37-525(-)
MMIMNHYLMDGEKKTSKSTGKTYYWHSESKTSQWERPTDAAKRAKPNGIRAMHLLIKHKQSRKPSSWKESNITRTKEEARSILQKHIDLLKATPSSALEEKFAELARIHSDCSSAKKGGDLGFFKKGQMQPSFEIASFALDVGQLSDIVDSDSGLHVIYRTE